jgi:hypothetical protein
MRCQGYGSRPHGLDFCAVVKRLGDCAIDLVGEIVLGKGSNAKEGGSGDVWLRREAFEGEPVKR